MKLQILVSALKQDAVALAKKMNLFADTVIINQCDESRYEALEQDGVTVECWHCKERGIGLSRNTAFEHSDADIVVFSDDDIVYDKGVRQKVVDAFEQYKQADVLLFNVIVQESRRTYWTNKFRRVRWYSCGRYPAFSIAVRRQKITDKGLKYSTFFGGGAKYCNGEDSLFLMDCIKAGLKVYCVPVEIGEEIPRQSTWFNGYNKKFFYDRGVLYKELYRNKANIASVYFLLKTRKNINESNISLKEARKSIFAGVKDGVIA